VPSILGRRLGLTAGESGFLLVDPPADEPPQFPDLHAGDGGTSAMLHVAPETVRTAIVPTLKPTDLSPEAVATWRQGYEDARRITPQGYLGAPAAAAASRGAARLTADAGAYADAIAKAVKMRADETNRSR
jgi:creatinine amidohydrolase